MGFGWISEEDLLARRQGRMGRRLYAMGPPRGLRHAIFVEQGPALVRAMPSRGAVREGLGEQNGGSRRRVGDDDEGRFIGRVEDLFRQSVMAFVTAGDAAEPAVIRPGVCEAPRDDDEPVGYLVLGKVIVLALHRVGDGRHRAVVRVQAPPFHARFHVHAVDAVEAKAIAQSEAQNGHDCRVVEEIAKGLAPLQKTRSTWRAAKSLDFSGRRQLLLVKQGVERFDFVRAQGVFNHEIALQVEQVLLCFEVFHDGLPMRMWRYSAVPDYSSLCRPTRLFASVALSRLVFDNGFPHDQPISAKFRCLNFSLADQQARVLNGVAEVFSSLVRGHKFLRKPHLAHGISPRDRSISSFRHPTFSRRLTAGKDTDVQ